MAHLRIKVVRISPFRQLIFTTKAALKHFKQVIMASKSISFVFLIVLLTTATLAADPPTASIMEVLQTVRQDWISTLLQAIRAANLVDTLQKGIQEFMTIRCFDG